MLVFNAAGQVDSVRQLPDLRLDNVRSCGRAMRHVPLVFPVKQRCLFLRARERNAEVLVGADAERIAGKVAENGGDLLIASGAAINGAGAPGCGTVGKELQRPDAIAADGGEQAVSIGAISMRAFGDASADVVIIGQKIVKNSDDGIADITILPQWQRHGNGDGIFPREPLLVILEIDCATALAPQPPDQPCVEVDVERRTGRATRHQNRSSIASAVNLVRGRMTSSRSSAASASIKMRSCVAGSPASSFETVA